ncbi:GH25 family lysozyme [Aeoliella sp.]|uniref:GH25 family lysozyme n=1 Tax=Aeoliella sp. TaxID=2795800 RepID=UPI003CCB74ED
MGKQAPARCLVVLVLVMGLLGAGSAAAQDRVLGLDVSRWQGTISQTTWNNIYNVENRRFVFIRSSRGGTTGVDKRQGGYPSNDNDDFTLSQRYDDPYFARNINRATTAGLLAGPYHFARLDVVESTPNTNGIANTGTDEANHFLEMAGAWMRPGYLLPVFDLESGQNERTATEIAQFSIDFSDRVYQQTGVRPVMYINGNYSVLLQGVSPSLRQQVVDSFPVLWDARYAYQSSPNSGEVQTAHPKDSFNGFYGPWDDGGTQHPWAFWQYASTGRLNSFNNGNSNLDFNVAQGGMEFLKDHLVPALWMDDQNGQWTDLANWNSGTPPTAPVQAPGQLAPASPTTLPTVRLPAADDTVILDRPNADITVTLASGAHTIRKLQVHESLDITGGSLTVGYVPSEDSTPYSAEFYAPVTLADGASLSVHTLLVDATETFSIGGTLSFDTLMLARIASEAATVDVLGDIALNPLDGAAAVIEASGLAGPAAQLNLGGVDRTLHIGNGAALVDLSVDVPIVGGNFTKDGPGALRLTSATQYAGDIDVAQGTLVLDDLMVDDEANVLLSAGATLQLDFAGTTTVASLLIDGSPVAGGTWGGIGSGADNTTTQLTGAGLLLVPPTGVPGDFNDDGVVNLADYIVWRNQLGADDSVLPPGSTTDGSGMVDSGDYDTWKANFNPTAASLAAHSSQQVPEPRTVLLALMLLLPLATRRWSLAIFGV